MEEIAITKTFCNDLVLETILKFLPIKELMKINCVSKQWNAISTKLQQKRKSISWITYSNEDEQVDGHEYFAGCINKLSSLPQHALVFCTSSLQDLGIRVTQHDCNVSGGRPPRKTRPKIVRTNQYIKQQLPCKCQIYGVCMDGVVATMWDNSVNEHEGTRVLTSLLLPNLPGVDIYGFYKDEDDAKHTIQQITGVPDDKNIRLLLFFGLEPSDTNDTFTTKVLQHYQNVVIAGGIVDSFLTEDYSSFFSRDLLQSSQSESEAEESEPFYHGVAFCGSEEDLQVASIVIPSSAHSSKDIERLLKKLKDTSISDKKSFAFMFACIGRGKHFHGNVENVESSLFKKYFPNTPLLGFFGNGELGYDYLPNYASGATDRDYRPFNLTTDFNRELYHAYSTVFVIVSLK